MRKYINVFISLSILFILCRLLFNFFYKGKAVNYTIQTDGNLFEVNERYVRKQSNQLNHYYFEVTLEGDAFSFLIGDVFRKKSYIIENIYSFQNDQYSCILPVFSNRKIETDILCYEDSMLYHYRDLKGQSLELDSFADSMEVYGYQVNFSVDSTLTRNGMQIQNGNLVSSHILVVPSYKGLYVIDSKNKNIITTLNLFNQDVYTQSIQGLISKYYVVADYNESYTFHKFILIDVESGKRFSITSNPAISMDSYVQGAIGNFMYIIDRSNRRQYKIDVSNKAISISGNTNMGIQYYQNGEYEARSIYDALNQDLYMYPYRLESDVYDFVDLYNGIYYSYLKVDNGYDVYVSFAENPSLYSFGFHLASIDRVQYVDDYVYYIENDTLSYYHPKYGVIDIATYSEFFYNQNLDFWVYRK